MSIDASDRPGQLFIYTGQIFLRLEPGQSAHYAPGASLASTILNGSMLVSKRGDFALPLNDSVVESISSSELRISIGHSELSSLVTRVIQGPFTSSGFELVMGANGTAIPLTDYGSC